MPSFLKSLEHTSHVLRSYVLPSHIRAYRELSKLESIPDGKLVVFDITNIQIDHVMGRYLYHIVKDFHSQGYTPLYVSNYHFLATTHHKRYKAKLLEMPFHTISNLTDIDKSYIYITDKTHAKALENASKVIRIDYKTRRPANDSEIPLPFFVHPEVSTLPSFPPAVDMDKTRNSRIFFGGNTRERGYGDGPVNRKYGIMNRVHVMQTVKDYIPEDQQCIIRQVSEEFPKKTFIYVETQHFKVPFAQWLQTIMEADFFVACPGTRMPLCHNLVEALSCGSIPIIQYYRYLNPELVDGKNCLTFHDEASLRIALQKAIDMPQEEILRMRKAALAYYQDNLTEGKFADSLVKSKAKETTLLLNAYRSPIR